ncbi:MAG: TIGR01212 family radical SAM protein [Ruminococcus sp.]|nr:TIGR01212 family radical SAM protein [Ruminococcus sp.]MDE7099045.1 TIGR01212 family radical SAM protein [Ruminococcus sp.]
MFEYTSNNKRYHTLNYYFKKNYGHKLYKAVIDCGFTCPNIDGSKGYGGCIFCDGGSGYFTKGELDIAEQLKAESERIFRKNGTVPIIAYFQANTNTYASAEKLRDIYYKALDFPHIEGISIGTRADCLSDDIIDLLCEINSLTNLTVELGMQTVHESTIKLINRCCTHDEFIRGYNKLKQNNIRVCLHIINSLPFETSEMMTETARQTAMLRPDGLKIQMLHVIKGTRLAEMYKDGRISLMSREEYIDIVVKQLELIPPETVIERITGDGDKNKLIAPDWSRNKIAVIGGIDKELAVRDTYQGRLYKS